MISSIGSKQNKDSPQRFFVYSGTDLLPLPPLASQACDLQGTIWHDLRVSEVMGDPQSSPWVNLY